MSVKDDVREFVKHASAMALGGSAAGMFDRMHMQEIKRLEEKVLTNTDNSDSYMAAFRKEMSHNNAYVRWRTAFVLGKLMQSNPASKEIDRTVKELINCLKDPSLFEPMNTVGREVFNALGRSGKDVAEDILAPFVNDNTINSIRPNLLVSLGKIGGVVSIRELDILMGNSKLKDADKMYAAWALGRIGSVQNEGREGFPLPRKILTKPLEKLVRILQSPVAHPDIHYYTAYAIAEICDQRETYALAELISGNALRNAETAVEKMESRRQEINNSLRKNNKFRDRSDFHTSRLIDICKLLALRMIRGQKLDSVGERILLDARILLEAKILED